MLKSKIAGIGSYIPESVISNHDLTKYMDTSDEWIQERTGIVERRYGHKHRETTTSMGAKAALQAIERAGIQKEDIDFIVFATLSADYFFPGCGVLLQRELGIASSEIGALDIRNQCSGFIYGLSVADQFIRTGMYKNILLVGSEMHSMGLDYSTEGRNVTVIFGDGAGAVVLQGTTDENSGVISTSLHSDGTYAEKLSMINPGSHGNYHNHRLEAPVDYGFPEEDDRFGGIFVTEHMVANQQLFPYMDGPFVFKMAVQKFPQVIQEVLEKASLKVENIDLLVPHQANLRISQFVQRKLGLRDDQVWNNIQKYGNTTAASIPIALCEAFEAGAVKAGDLICLAAFGSGFTWGAAVLRW